MLGSFDICSPAKTGTIRLKHYHLKPIPSCSTRRLLVHGFITSRLNYCNGLFASCSVVVRQRLQQIQNIAARLVCSEPALSHAAPLLHRLHWLPTAKLITYKLCVLMYDIYHGQAPAYITDLCSRCGDHRLRSTTHDNFVMRRTRTRFADSSFTVAGLAAWNTLPRGIYESVPPKPHHNPKPKLTVT